MSSKLKVCGVLAVLAVLSFQVKQGYALEAGVQDAVISTADQAVTLLNNGQFRAAALSLFNAGNGAAMKTAVGLLTKDEQTQVMKMTTATARVDKLTAYLINKKSSDGFASAINSVMTQANSTTRLGAIKSARIGEARTKLVAYSAEAIAAAKEVTSNVQAWVTQNIINDAQADVFSRAGPELIGIGLSIVDENGTCYKDLGPNEIQALVTIISAGVGKDGLDMVLAMQAAAKTALQVSDAAAAARIVLLSEQRSTNPRACGMIADRVHQAFLDAGFAAHPAVETLELAGG